MSGQTILLVQVANSGNGNKLSLCKAENFKTVNNPISYERKIILVPEPKQEPQSPSYEVNTPPQDVKPIDLRVSPEPQGDLSNTRLDDSGKYARMRHQNNIAAKRNRTNKKSAGESTEGQPEKHTRRPRMDLSQLDDAAKYKRIRELNNMASKRLREKKRQMMQNASEELLQLAVQNAGLKDRLSHLQTVKEELRELLLQTSK